MLDIFVNSDIQLLKAIAEFMNQYPNATPILIFYFIYKIVEKVIEKSPTTANTVESLAKDALTIAGSFIPGLNLLKIFKKK